MNSFKKLSTLVDAVEKLYLLPESEMTGNGQLMAEIRNAFSTHSLDSIINDSMRELREAKNAQPMHSMDQNNLLYAFAARENDRVQQAKGKSYITEIINAEDYLEDKPVKASPKADEMFSSVFNSVFSDGAV